MKKLFKTISVCSLSILTALSLAACGGNKTTKKETTKKVTTKATEGDCAINVEGAMDGVNLEFTTTKMVDGVPTPEVLDVNKKYAAGTMLYIRVTNNSTKKIKFSALEGNLIAGRDYIDASQLGGLMGIKLTKTLKFKLEDASSIQTASLDIIEDATADTETLINSVHVYSDSFLDKPDFTLADKLEIGEKIKIYVWNCASDVELTIKNGTEDDIVKTYEILSEEEQGPDGKGHDDFIEITVKGDVKVEIEALGGKVNDKNDNNDVELNMFYKVDGKTVNIKNGDNLPYGTVVNVEAMSNSSTRYMLVVSDKFGYTIMSSVIEEYDKISTFVVRNSESNIDVYGYGEYNFTATGNSDVTLTPKYLDGSEEKAITGNKVPQYALVNVKGKNNSSTTKYIVKCTKDDETMVKVLNPNEEYDFTGLEIISDVTFEVIPYAEYTVSFNNNISSDKLTLKTYALYADTDIPVELNEGDKVAEGALIMVAVNNLDGGDYAITITNGSTKEFDNTPIPTTYSAPYVFSASGDILIKVAFTK